MIVYIDMVADLFHPGHIGLFMQVKGLYPGCDIFVGLMSDKEAREYKRPPILSLLERTIMLESCRYVSKVLPAAPMPITREFIEENGIDLVIHGDDISESSRNYWYGEAIKLNKYKEIPYTHGLSTTDIINRIGHTDN